MRRLRSLNVLWAFVFIVPTWLALGHSCRSNPIDAFVHVTMFLHARLPEIVTLAILASLAAVTMRLVRADASLATLHALAAPLPHSLATALAREAARLEIAVPAVTYLDVAMPLCYTVVPGPAILISRGFLSELDDDALALVFRHELIHVRRRDPLRGLLWHLAFSALLIPGFGGLERWLYDRRERRTAALAGGAVDARFAQLGIRVRDTERRLEGSLGRAYAGALRPERVKRYVFLRPALAASVFAALLASHHFFITAMPMVDRHHC